MHSPLCIDRTVTIAFAICSLGRTAATWTEFRVVQTCAHRDRHTLHSNDGTHIVSIHSTVRHLSVCTFFFLRAFWFARAFFSVPRILFSFFLWLMRTYNLHTLHAQCTYLFIQWSRAFPYQNQRLLYVINLNGWDWHMVSWQHCTVVQTIALPRRCVLCQMWRMKRAKLIRKWTFTVWFMQKLTFNDTIFQLSQSSRIGYEVK